MILTAAEEGEGSHADEITAQSVRNVLISKGSDTKTGQQTHKRK